MAKKAVKAKQEGTVVEASMSAGQSGAIGGGITANAIEQAMHLATMNALADGITDPAEILKLKLEARERVKAAK
jgi:hypothetical protein